MKYNSFDVELPSVLPDEVETEMQITITQFNKLIELVAILGEVLRTIVGNILCNAYDSHKAVRCQQA